MKKTISYLLIIALIATSFAFTPKKVEAKKYWWNDLIAQKNSIKFKWTIKKKATKYVIYRALAKDYEKVPAKSKYKKIKTIKNRYVKKYVDKKVKAGKFYSYYVKAYKKKKVIADSYDKEYSQVKCKGLSVPEIKSGGYQEYFTNGNYEFHLYDSNSCTGAKYTGKLKFYRREKGQSKFKAVKLKKVKGWPEWVDNSVKKGNTYYYKAKCYQKKKKKTTYSGFSKTIEVYAGNYSAEYKIKTFTPSGLYENTRELRTVISISNASAYNGKTVINKIDNDYGEWEYESVVTGPSHYYNVSMTKYSEDNVTWHTFPKDGIELTGGKTFYLEIMIRCRDTDEIFYGGNDTDYISSKLTGSSGIQYCGPVDASTYFTFDLKNGKGWSICDFDF